MKRYLSLSLLMVGLAALASADEPSTAPADLGRVWQVQRNQALVQDLVEGGLHLAKAEDHLQRARYCNDLATSLADEIRQAADDHDGDRAVELGWHLQDVLQNGVAANLNKERAQIPHGSTRETEMNSVRIESGNITDHLLKELDQILKDNPAALKEVLQAVEEAQAAVAAAGKGK
jgi:hypothetical protein